MSNVKLGKTSVERLEQVHPDLQKVMIKAFESLPFDVTITEGMRTLEKQKEYVAKGTSWTMKSKHLKQPDGYSHAIDVVPYPVDWNDLKRFDKMAEIVLKAAKDLDVDVVWGGTWTRNANDTKSKKYDGPHFQLGD